MYLVAAVQAGNTDRARVLASHLRWYRTGLHNHHQGEDELIWPLLHARVRVHTDVVTRMEQEQQHVRIAQSLDEVMSALPVGKSQQLPPRESSSARH